MPDAADQVIYYVNRSNQCGGRMLSVSDLLLAGTFDKLLLARVLERIEAGSSWMVGARPGGAGKTTVMSALLALLPPGEPVVLAAEDESWRKAPAGTCVVAYEISPGGYDGYIWGEALRAFLALGRRGCRLVTNLHADTPAEARRQLIAENQAPPEHFDSLGMFIPVSLVRTARGLTRRVREVYTLNDGNAGRLEPDAVLSPRARAITGFLDACLRDDLRAVEAVRAAWLDFFASDANK
jgi:type IV secretory pathway ATPase VirB11/archaellum biosynthesis ATPase